MRKPKGMPPEEEAAWTEWERLYLLRKKASPRNFPSDSPERVRERHARYKKAYPEKEALRLRAKGAKQRESLSITYIASRLKIPAATLRQYPELLEAKREHLKTLRQLKNQTNAQEPQ